MSGFAVMRKLSWQTDWYDRRRAKIVTVFIRIYTLHLDTQLHLKSVFKHKSLLKYFVLLIVIFIFHFLFGGEARSLPQQDTD